MQFNKPEESWQLFVLLEAFSDGMGAWRFLPTEGHLLDQPEDIIQDLLQWKYLANIVTKINQEKQNASVRQSELSVHTA